MNFLFRHSWKVCCWEACPCKSLPHTPVLLCTLFSECVGTVTTVSASSFYKAEEILWAAGATTIVTLALTLFALQTKVRIPDPLSIARELWAVFLCPSPPVLTHTCPLSHGPQQHGLALSETGPGSLSGKLGGQRRQALIPMAPSLQVLLG